VPACVQLGASLDFVAGAIPRAPRWMQRCGLEWLYRTLREPRRMLPRYAADAAFLARAVVRDLRTS
jgi:exopolysaccharide biosynthesis WecB/TagA/CpsF family protein